MKDQNKKAENKELVREVKAIVVRPDIMGRIMDYLKSRPYEEIHEIVELAAQEIVNSPQFTIYMKLPAKTE